MKEGRLKDSCIVVAGQSPKGSSYNEDGIGLEFHQGKKAFGEVLLQPSNVWTTEITKTAEPLDILMSVRAPVGPTNITNRRICIGRGLAAIRCKEGVLQKYVFYALKNIETKIIGNNGAVFNSINKKQIENLSLPTLPLPEQQRIVAYLDAEFAKIESLKVNVEKQLQAAKDLFQVTLKYFITPKKGWETQTLDNIASIYNGNSINAEYKKQHFFGLAEGYPFIATKDVSFDGSVDYNNGIKIPFDTNYKLAYPESVFICAEGGSAGRKIAYINQKVCFGNKLFCIQAKKSKLLGKFIYYFLTSNIFQIQFHSLLRGLIGGVSAKKFKSIIISFPSLSEQQHIADNLDTLSSNVKALQTNYNETITLCNNLKQALLKKVFE